MSKLNFLKIINEELAEFDFLNNTKVKEEEEYYVLLNNKDFQKKYIIDSITKMGIAIKIDESEIKFDEKDDEVITFKATVGFNYEDFELFLVLSGYIENKIPDWNNVDVSLYTTEGDKIEFNELNFVSDKIYELFVRSYLEPILGNNSPK